MLLHDVKVDTKDYPILQNPSQEPLMSAEYDHDHDVLLVILGSWNGHTIQEWHTMLIYDVNIDIKDDPILQNSKQEPPMSFKYDCVLYALIIMLRS